MKKNPRGRRVTQHENSSTAEDKLGCPVLAWVWLGRAVTSVKRGENPEDWAWSSFRHYVTGVEGVVEIESEWTGRKRERMGMPLRVRITKPATAPP